MRILPWTLGVVSMAATVFVASATSSAVLFSATFDGGTASGWAPTSGTWAVCEPAGATSDRYCQSDPAYLPPMSLAGDNGWSDYSVQTVVNFGNDAKGQVAVLGRVQDKYHFYELALAKDSTGAKRWWLNKYNTSGLTTIASGPFAYQGGVDYLLRLTLVNTSLTAAVSTDGGLSFQTLGKGTDAQYRVGRIGLKTKSTAASFDAVRVVSAGSTPPNTRRFGHVVLAALENHSASEVLGSPYLPYFNGLAAQYGLATNYYANVHPSVPNYFAWTTGQFFFQTTPLSAGTNNVVKALLHAGKSWSAYFDDPTSGTDVFASMPEVAASAAQRAHLVPITPNFAADVQANRLPRYVMIHPNLKASGHDCRGAQPCLTVVDNWLLDTLGPYIASSGFRANNDLLLVAWDEGNLLDHACSAGPTTILLPLAVAQAGAWTCGGHTVFLVVSPSAKAGYVSTAIYHDEAILRVMLEGLGITEDLPGAASFAPNLNEFFK